MGKPSFKNRKTILLIEYATRFVLAFLLSAATIFSGLSPFAVAFTAAAGAGAAGLVTLFGAALGYLLLGGFFWALKYTAICVLVCAAAFVFRDTRLYRQIWFMPAVASFMTACCGFVYGADEGWRLIAVALFLTEVVFAGGCTYFYKMALSPWSARLNYEPSSEIRHTASILILLATVLIALSGITVFGLISLGHVIAALAVLLAAYKGGVGLGSASGLALGIAMDASIGSPFFSMAFGISGLVSGIFSRHGRLVFLVSFILTDAVAFMAVRNGVGSPAVLYEVFIAAVLFMLLPHSFLSKVGALLPADGSGYGALKAREYTKERIEQASAAFRELYETVKTAAGADKNDNDIATVFDRAAEVTCRTCPLASRCWNREYEDTLTMFNDIAPKMLERGKLLKMDFPDHFAETCLNLTGLIDAVNEEVRGLLCRRRYRNRLRENQSAAFNQYADIASILKGLAAELGSDISLEPLLERRLQKYLRSQSVDAGTAVFRGRGGRLRAEITGGLGPLKKESAYLDKLSAVLGVRLCVPKKKNRTASRCLRRSLWRLPSASRH